MNICCIFLRSSLMFYCSYLSLWGINDHKLWIIYLMKPGSLIRHTSNKIPWKGSNVCSNKSLYPNSLHIYHDIYNIYKKKVESMSSQPDYMMAHKPHLCSEASILCLVNSKRDHNYRNSKSTRNSAHSCSLSLVG